MKKIVSISLAFILIVLVLCSCSSKNGASCEEILKKYTWSAFMVMQGENVAQEGFDDGTGVINFMKFEDNGCIYKYMDKDSNGIYAGTYKVFEEENKVRVIMGENESSYTFMMIMEKDYCHDDSNKTIPVLKVVSSDSDIVEYYADYDLFTETFGSIDD